MDEGLVHPEQFEISHASEHDHDYLDVFVNEPHATYVFDRGYIDFESFDQMKWDGYFFVSRIKKNTVVHVVDNLDVPKDTNSDILIDQYVLLGGNGYLTSLMRLVTIRRKKDVLICESLRMMSLRPLKTSAISITRAGKLSCFSSTSNNT
ncbi:hypothetical protein APU01nite_23170 [Alkalibacterium putridalgicola]|nr:hypothetical protein APU01nite_23170 [Alkalibacterium putridalgicola]